MARDRVVPDEEPMTSPFEPQPGTRRSAGRTAARATLLIGLWYIIAPWVFGAHGNNPGNIWNNVVVGILIAVLAAGQLNARAATAWAAWCNALLGAWAFFSPWIYGYTTDAARLVNSLGCGAAVLLLSIAAFSSRRPVLRA
jgi:hypothetical protein